MKSGPVRRAPCVLAATILFAAVAGLPVCPAAAQDTSPLQRLVIGNNPGASAAERRSIAEGPTRRWYLAATNRTTDIDSAWHYRNNIVIFGWADLAGLNTVIDATTGAELLEFLGYGPVVTKGLIVFRRFYPHFTDPDIISDRIAVLDLSRPFPRFVPAKDQLPTEDVGVDIYPTAPGANARHLIGGNYLVGGKGTSLFVADRITSRRLCVVRIPLPSSAGGPEKQACLTAADLRGADPAKVHIAKFSETPLGDLTLAVDLPGTEPGAKPVEFSIDSQSLALTRMQPAPSGSETALWIPWAVQKKTLLSFSAPDLGSTKARTHLADSIKAQLSVDGFGNVRDVSLSGSTDEVLDRVRKAILAWKFKPAVLDGHQVDVTTGFILPAGDLLRQQK